MTTWERYSDSRRFIAGAAFVLAALGLARSATAGPFTQGTLVVVRVGDGSATIGTTATAVFLDEYATTGTLVQTIAMPTAVSGSNKICTVKGTAVSEASLTLSADGRYLLLGGYNKAPG